MDDELMRIVVENLESEKRRRFANVEEELELEKRRRRAKVEEEIESTKRRICSEFKSYFKDGNQTTSQRNMKLELRNGIARKILTGEEIRGEGDVPIEVALVDDETGDVVDDEPEASAQVEFLLLNASGGDDWTPQQFDASIAPQVEGKQPVLAGNVSLKLQRGIAAVKNIKIRHHASMLKPPEFKLGARVVGAASVRIKEAKTEAFALKNFRAKYYKKHKNPSLSDPVSRLVSVWKGGKIDKRLQENKIYTVEDFLIQLLINPQRLMSIVKQPKKWKGIVNNAQACLSSERMYCYVDPRHKTGVVFNILGHVLGLCSGSYYSQSEKEKADAGKLLASAYQNWGQVKAFHDQNSLQQYIDNIGASEMVGESSSTMRLNVSFHGANSTLMNLFGDQTGAVQDFAPFTTGSDGSLFEGVNEYIYNTFCHSGQHDDGLMNESNADEGSDAASQVVVGGRKRWKILFYVLTFRKRVALDVSPNRKKQS